MTVYNPRDYEGEFNLLKAERRLIERAYERCGWDREKMAEQLGVTSRTLYNKIFQHQLKFK